MEFLFLTLVSFFLLVFILFHYMKQSTFLKPVAAAMGVFLTEYFCFSVVLLWLDYFSVRDVLIAQVLLNLVLFIPRLKTIQKDIHNIDFDLKKVSLILLLVCLCSAVSIKKSDVIETGCDAGMYFEKMITLVGNDTSKTRQLYEYGMISEDVNQEVLNLQAQQLGLYKYEITNGNYFYEHHAIPTWPAFMALFAKIFGIYSGGQALTFVLMVCLFSLYFALENLCNYHYSKFVTIPLLGLMPLLVYLTKTPLSELSFLAMLLFGFWLLSEKDRRIKVSAILPLGLLGFIHFSTFMYIPVLFLALLSYSVVEKKKEYGWVNIGSLILFGASIYYCYNVSKVYTQGQLYNTLGSYFSSETLLLFLFTCLLLLIQIIFLYAIRNVENKLVKFFEFAYNRLFFPVATILILVVLAFTIYQGYLLGFTDKYVNGKGNWAIRASYADMGLKSLLHLNIFSIIMGSSYICLPYVLYKLVFKRQKCNLTMKIMLMMFLYSLTIYTVIRCDTPSNYYASRYFIYLLIPSIIVLTAMLLENGKEFFAIILVSTITAVPFDLFMMKTVGYGGNTQMLKDVLGVIKPNSVVMVNENNRNSNVNLVNNLRQLNGSLVFSEKNKKEIIEKFKGSKEIYIIDLQPQFYREYDKILEKQYEINGDIVSATGGYPLSISTRQDNLYVYKIVEAMQNKIDVIAMNEKDQQKLINFYGLEKNSQDDFFAWTKEKSEIQLKLSTLSDNIVTISCLDIPKEVFESIPVLHLEFFINGQSIQNVELTKENYSGKIQFTVKKDLVLEEENILTIKSDTWSPKKLLHLEDERNLGIPITSIEVSED